MVKNKKQSLPIIIVLLFGVVLMFFGTNGFTAFTAEQARTHKLIDQQPAFPKVTFEDTKYRVYPFEEFSGKYVFITFIYTACTDVCPQLEMNMFEVYEQINPQYIGEDIIFLSISFDPKNDTPEVLDRYRGAFNSDGESWRMARINDEAELKTLLDAFGVIVIPDENGHFQHNVAFYLVDPEGTLVDVLDFTAIDEAADKINTLLENHSSSPSKVGDAS